jgi:hypothetical protein
VYDVKINGAWENTTENIKSSAAEGPVTTSWHSVNHDLKKSAQKYFIKKAG